MWSKILSVINCLLILTVAGLGFFQFNQFDVNLQRLTAENKAVTQKLEEVTDFQAELMKNPLIALAGDPLNTLSYEEGKLIGFVDVDVLLANEELILPEVENPVEVAVLAIKNGTDGSITEFISTQTEAETKYFDMDSDLQFIPVGCLIDGNIEGIDSEEGAFEELSGATIDETIKVRLFFNGKIPTDNVCEGTAAKIQILK
jgi:hypothetical protein